MKWLINIYNPNKHDIVGYYREFDLVEEKLRVLKWLEGKTIGKPKATKRFTVKELVEIGMVGVYVNDD